MTAFVEGIICPAYLSHSAAFRSRPSSGAIPYQHRHHLALHRDWPHKKSALRSAFRLLGTQAPSR